MTFICLGNGYARDKSTYWYLDKTFKVHALKMLNVLNPHFVRDDKTAYAEKHTACPHESFAVIYYQYSIGNKAVFFRKIR